MVTRTSIINWLISHQDYRSYLEIGVGQGANFGAVQCIDKTGVDPALGRYSFATPTHRMTSDEFFANNRRKFDLVFIDGLHHEEVVWRDLCNALTVLSPGGMVVCHDLNPSNEQMQRVPREAEVWTGDCWKAWVRMRLERPYLLMLVCDTDMGVGIIFPAGCVDGLTLNPDHVVFSWDAFNVNRAAWLNLKPVPVLGQALFGRAAAKGLLATNDEAASLAVVTLWRNGLSSQHADVLNWYRREQFPAGTHFIWVVPSGSAIERQLEEYWIGRDAANEKYSMEMIIAPNVSFAPIAGGRQVVAALYVDALQFSSAEMIFSVADDIVPLLGSLQKLIAVYGRAPDNTAAIMAIYHNRMRSDSLCAEDMTNVYLRPDREIASLEEVSWCGGGCTMYRGDVLRATLSAFDRGGVQEWEATLCAAFREKGCRMLVHYEIAASGDCGL